MSNGFQSIEDLISEDETEIKNSGGDAGAQSKLKVKQKEIEIRKTEELTKERAKKSGLPYIDLFGFPISAEALSLIPESESRRLKIVCFLYVNEEIRIGAVEATEEVREFLNKLAAEHYCRGQLYVISERSLVAALKLYKTIPKTKERVKGIKIPEEDLKRYSEKFSSFKDLQVEIKGADTTQVVAMAMAAAVKLRASDVHIEKEEKDVKIRLRIDGVLYDAAVFKKELWSKIVSRLKLLAKVKINIEDKPQDGRFSIFMDSKGEGETKHKIDIRASFLPTAYGESVVMRLLDSNKKELSFKDLGLWGDSYHQLKRQISRPNGMIITTGPTGSGKTTTLYAILKKLNNPKTKIITIEDPIEYQVEGINQSQVSKDYTFAKGLRSIVRQDPDIIMVGEIRDLETAEIAIQAALTGHLVLSTIHTNDASGTVPRLLSMGVKPFLLAPAMNAMIGQRLVRRICEKCKKEISPSEEQKERIKEIFQSANKEAKEKLNLEKDKFYIGEGCDNCQGLGYKGRMGIYEIMIMNKDLEELIQEGKVSEFNLREAAIRFGMLTMAQDGILKAAKGKTTVEEVLRVAE